MKWGMALVAASLVGCAGEDFMRPPAEATRLGQTTYAEVVQRLGAPKSTGTQVLNERQVKVISYSYATRFEEPLEPDVNPARAIAYFFADDVLVGHQFLSSFKSDHTNFDETRMGAIEKGKTSRSEVIRILGNPSGAFIAPIAKGGRSSIQYSYYASRREPLSPLIKTFRKTLTVIFDESDVASEVQFSKLSPD